MKKKSFLKASLISLGYVLVLLLFFGKNLVTAFPSPKFWVGMILVGVVLGWQFHASYQRALWEEKLNFYVKKNHLTPEVLGKITGFSGHTFTVAKSGRVLAYLTKKEDRALVLQKLAQVYGPVH